MIKSFNSKETEKIWQGIRSTKLPNEIQEVARRKLRMLNNSVDLKDLRSLLPIDWKSLKETSRIIIVFE